MGYCPVLGELFYRPLIIEGARHKKFDNRTEIVIFFDRTCYSKITDLTVKYFPIISEELDEKNHKYPKYPICNTRKNSEKEGYAFYSDFEFDNSYGTYWRQVLNNSIISSLIF
jgi:hypothetical protein